MIKIICTLACVLILSACADKNSDKGNDSKPDTKLRVNTLGAKSLGFYQGASIKGASLQAAAASSDKPEPVKTFKANELIKLDDKGNASAVFNQEIKTFSVAAGKKANDYVVMMGNFHGKLESRPTSMQTAAVNSDKDYANTDLDTCIIIAVNKDQNDQKGYCLDSADYSLYGQKADNIAVATWDNKGVTNYVYTKLSKTTFEIKQWDGKDKITTLYQSQDSTLLGRAEKYKLYAANGYYFFWNDRNYKAVYGNSAGFNILSSIVGAHKIVNKVYFINSGLNANNGRLKYFSLINGEIKTITVNAASGCGEMFSMNDIVFSSSDHSVVYSLAKKSRPLCKVVGTTGSVVASGGAKFDDGVAYKDTAYLLGKDTNNKQVLYKLDLANDSLDTKNYLADLGFSNVDKMYITADRLLAINGTGTNGLLKKAWFNPVNLVVTNSTSNSVGISQPIAIE